MIALSLIADIKCNELFENIEDIYSAISGGSVITVDNGIKVLAKVAAGDEEYNKNIFPYLLEHIKTCRPKEIPQHSESISVCINSQNKSRFIDLLKSREKLLTDSQFTRIKRLYKKLDI